MFATATPGSGRKISAPGGRSRGHDGRQSYEPVVRVDDPRGLRWPAGCDAQRVPPTAVTPDPSRRWLFRPGVTRPLAFFVGRGDSANDALDVGEPGFIRRPRVPDHAGSKPAIQTETEGASRLATAPGLNPDERRALRVRLPLLPLQAKCPWPSGPGVGLPNRTGGFDSRRALCRPSAVGDRRLFDNAADELAR